MKLLLSFILIMGFCSTQSFSSEQYTLGAAKEKVSNENINIAIAYENYITVKNQAKAKTYQLLPSLSIDLLISDYQYTILRSVIPEPQRFFDAAAAKDLSHAAELNKTIVTKNLLQDLEQTIFLFQFHKEMVASFAHELEIKTEIATRSKEAYDLGAISFSDFYTAQRAVVFAKTQYTNGAELLSTEEFALKLILQVKDNHEALGFDNTAFYNSSLNFPQDINSAMTLSVNNSTEIDQFTYLIEAAKKTKKGVAISWISWGGVGFDYFARVSIAKSEVAKLELERTKAVYEVKNQVAALYSEIANQKEKMGYQSQLLAMAEADYKLASENYDQLLGSFITVKKSELDLMSAQRDSRRLEYELELKYIKLKRLMGANMLTNTVPKL